MEREHCRLIWMAGDWNISDALTKKTRECRQGFTLFLKTRVWKMQYDEKFVISAKKLRQRGKTAINEMKGYLNNFWGIFDSSTLSDLLRF